MRRIIGIFSKMTRSYCAGVNLVSAMAGSWPSVLICTLLLDARMRNLFPEDLPVLLGILGGFSAFALWLGMLASGMFQRMGFGPWLAEMRDINAVVNGDRLMTQAEWLQRTYDPRVRRHNRKRKNKARPLPHAHELPEDERRARYEEGLRAALKAITAYPRKYSLIAIAYTFGLVVIPVFVINAALTYDFQIMLPIIVIGAIYYATFMPISFELNTNYLRGDLKRALKPDVNEAALSLRTKFTMQFLIIVLSLLALFEMMRRPDDPTKRIELEYSISFIVLVIALAVYLSGMYIKSILQALRELAAAVGDLGKGGSGRLYLASLDREFVSLGNDYTKAASEVVEYRHSLERKVNDKTRELETANVHLTKKNEIIQTELDLASDIQGGLFPDTDSWRELRFAYFYRPMEKVSGDFFDIFTMPGDRLGVLVADVSGHGVPAALITTMAKISFSSKGQHTQSTSKILAMVNKDLQAHVKTQDYMTAFFVIFEPDYRLQYTNASHQKAIHIKADGSIEELDSRGFLLGADESLFDGAADHYEQKFTSLGKGDRLILFTDGINEMRNKSGEEFGHERIMRHFAQTARQLPIDQAVATFKANYFDFIDKDHISDDITFLAVERLRH